MTVTMLIDRCANIRMTTRAFITNEMACILHNSSVFAIKPELMTREVSSFVISGDTLYIIVV